MWQPHKKLKARYDRNERVGCPLPVVVFVIMIRGSNMVRKFLKRFH